MGQEKLVEDLRGDLARGEVLVVVGTGVSRQATGDADCASWAGLIGSGIEHAVQTNLLNEPAATRLRARLNKKTTKDFLAVAQAVSKALGAPDGGELRRWLGETVGSLEVKDRTIIGAIHALGAPIATTNYDDLLTRGRGIEHVPWTDVPAAQEILREHRDAVLHLHGCFDHPESVVLGVRSYRKVLASHGAQAIQQALAANRTLLFIGCGEGLADPNFGALLEWIDAAFGKSVYRHYRLCLNSDPQEPDGRLFPIAYGDKFEDLAPFLLRELAPHNLTNALPNPGYCFGREREVEEVVTALLADNPQPLPILGGPGMGKTTIALKALHDKRVAERFRERRWFVRCDGVKTRAELAAAIGRVLDLPITSNIEPGVLAALAATPAALVLDNGETPHDADTAQVEDFLSVLATIDTLALVVTIRGHKRPRGVPWAPDTEPERLTDAAAAKVFVAVSGKRHFANDSDLPRLLVALDGVPLAITLMARYAELFESLEPVWSRWSSKRTAMLKDGEERDRLRNIAVSYELSIGVLGDAARRLLSVLAMLPDGVAVRDLEGVFADPDDAADELRRRALVFEEAQRVRMRAPLREHVAAVHPPDAGDARRVVDHYLALAANEGKKVGATGGAEAVARLAPEVANVEAMLGKGDPVPDDVLVDAVYGWAELMRFTGLGSPGPIERLATKAVAGARTDVAAPSFKSLGDIALMRSDYETARRCYEEALPLYREVGDVQGEAHCIRSLGSIAFVRSDHGTARRRYEEALPLYRQAGAVQGEANCIQSLGNIALERSDHETARRRYEEAQPLYRQVGDALGEANCIKSLGNIALRRSDHETARRRYEEAQPLYRQVGAVQGEANCIKSLGNVALERSDHETARRRYEEAQPLYRQVGAVQGEANCIKSLGDISFAEGARDDAESKYREALALYERIGEPYSVGRTHRRLARLATDDASRTAHVTAAREAWRSIGREDLVEEWLAELDEEKT
jgi:tetratricopeptide (TPR) repeat protein